MSDTEYFGTEPLIDFGYHTFANDHLMFFPVITFVVLRPLLLFVISIFLLFDKIIYINRLSFICDRHDGRFAIRLFYERCDELFELLLRR